MNNKITELFGIKYPIVQGGMVWNSSWKLAAAVSNAGGLGLIGAGSMYPDVLREHIQQCKKATNLPFGVNIPLLYPNIEEIIQIVLEEGVPVLFTSAGNPKTWTETLKKEGRKVAHVIANSRFAAKCDAAGVDAIVAEGFEAGGHNGREETTTLSLIPSVRETTTTPLLAAGGIATGRQILAAMSLGADGVQIGTRFAASTEGSGHDAFKQVIVDAKEGTTRLALKNLVPVRLVKNKFCEEITQLEQSGASVEVLREKLGKGRAKLGMFEGDLEEGELEIGQSASLIKDIQPIANIMDDMLLEYRVARQQMQGGKYFFGDEKSTYNPLEG